MNIHLSGTGAATGDGPDAGHEGNTDDRSDERRSPMNRPVEMTYEYRCGGCSHHFEVVRTFREWTSWPPRGAERPAGYPEEQPECPTCHSHDTAQLIVRDVNMEGRSSTTGRLNPPPPPPPHLIEGLHHEPRHADRSYPHD